MDVNTTNLHLHGLHVSPSPYDAATGTCGDNIRCTVRPGSELTFTAAIPDDHPTGTFWYHPHVHSTTALQVGGLMAATLGLVPVFALSMACLAIALCILVLGVREPRHLK